MQAVMKRLRKNGRGVRYQVSGRLIREPKRGSIVIIEFSDGTHEYVTTPVRRVLSLSEHVFYIETVNSRYRLEVLPDELPSRVTDDNDEAS